MRTGYSDLVCAACLDSSSHEGPAGSADVTSTAAGSHIVIVCQVDVEDKLTLLRMEATCSPALGQPGRITRHARCDGEGLLTAHLVRLVGGHC